MSIKIFNDYFFNFDILRLDLSNFTFKISNFLFGPKTSAIRSPTLYLHNMEGENGLPFIISHAFTLNCVGILWPEFYFGPTRRPAVQLKWKNEKK